MILDSGTRPYRVDVDSHDLTAQQLYSLHRRIDRDLTHYTALTNRMRQCGFGEDDALLRAGIEVELKLRAFNLAVEKMSREARKHRA